MGRYLQKGSLVVLFGCSSIFMRLSGGLFSRGEYAKKVGSLEDRFGVY